MAMKDLAATMNALCDALPFQTSWSVKDLTTGERADRLGDTPVPSASTRKISIMMAALKAVHDGKLALDQKVTIQAKYQDNDSGTFQHLTPGFWITFRDALVMMIIVSDNTCTGTVVDMVGLDAIQRYCDTVGMTRTVHRFGIPPKLGPDHTLDQVTTTTPNDQGLLLEAMLQGAEDKAAAVKLGVTPELCRLGLDILSWQKLKTRIPSQLPLRHQGGPQDRHGLARLHGRGHRLPRREAPLHHHHVHGARARRPARRHARLHRGVSADGTDGAPRLGLHRFAVASLDGERQTPAYRERAAGDL